MSKIKFVFPVLLTAVLSSCLPAKNKTSSTSSSTSGSTSSSTSGGSISNTGDYSGTPLTAWPSELEADLNTYFGEVLPFVAFDSGSFYYGYDSDEGAYFIGDDNVASIFSGYASKLISAGYSEEEDADVGTFYYKETTNGTEAYLIFDFYEATEDYASGNEIAIYFTAE